MNVWWGILIVFAAFALLFAYLWHVTSGDPVGATRAIQEWTAELAKLRAGIHGGDKCPRGRKGCHECVTERARLEARKKEIIAEIPKPLLAIGIVTRGIRWFISGR